MKLEYPKVRRDDIRDTTGGVVFEDPYRWMEDDLSPEVLAWDELENEFTQQHVRKWPHFRKLVELISKTPAEGARDNPEQRQGRWIFRVTGAGWGEKLEVAESRDGPWRTLADASEFGDDKAYGIYLYYPSPDGRYVAYCLSKGSVYKCVLYFVEVETGRVLPESTEIDWVVRATWAPDSSGLYVAVPHPRNFMEYQIFFQEVGKPIREGPEDVRIVNSPGPIPIKSDDGRYIGIMDGLFEQRLTHLKDLMTGEWAEFLPAGYEGGLMETVHFRPNYEVHFRGDNYIALSVTDQFPRGRVVSVPIATSTDISTWRELVPESERVLRSVMVLGERMVTTELLNTYTTIRVFDLEGNQVGEVPFPYPGNAVLGGEEEPGLAYSSEGRKEEERPSPKLVLHHTTLISRETFHYDLDTKELESVGEIRKVDGLVTRRVDATAKDGAKLPIFLTHKEDLDTSVPQPTLIFGYGGFNSATVARPMGDTAPFVQAGGILASTVIRGDSTFGRDWWRNAMGVRKQNSYDDMRSVTKFLHSEKITSPDKLAFWGGSNSGLLAGVCVTQMHDLYKVVVSRVGYLDMMHIMRDWAIAWACSFEWGDPRDPEIGRAIYEYSPYHNLRDGVEYPAFIAVMGDDDAGGPWHGRKFVARLREATASDEPVLLRVVKGGGHWAGGSLGGDVEQPAEWLAFVMEQLGMTL